MVITFFQWLYRIAKQLISELHREIISTLIYSINNSIRGYPKSELPYKGRAIIELVVGHLFCKNILAHSLKHQLVFGII